jgi:16S rRNA (uracil1498-N3)-methyltransferase
MPQDSPHEFVFFIDSIKTGDRETLINGSEHHHLSRVLKIASGAEVYMTDGRGAMYRGRVLAVGRKDTRVEILDRRDIAPPAKRITLALGRIRKDRFEAAVEQCTELGTARFIPFHSRKCRPHGYGPHFMQRLSKIAQSAVKQSFQAYMPVIEPERKFDELLALVARADVALVGEQGAPALKIPPRAGDVLVIVGPEGGFVDEERRALARSGAASAAAAPARLRSETAAVSLVSQVLLSD